MIRVRLRFLVKALICIMLVMLMLPFLLNHGEPKDTKKKAKKEITNEEFKSLRKRLKQQHEDTGESLVHFDQNIDSKVNREIDEGNSLNLMEQPLKKSLDEQIDVLQPAKQYGPKAVYKDGILGNFEPVVGEKRNGPGENGEPVYVSMAEKPQADRSTREFGFNMVASDKIAMDRAIPDTRLNQCQYWNYPEELPTASVIIVFHNEGFSTLMRTVHSVINTSPTHLLKEVVMVDDYSSKEHLQKQLEDYLVHFNGLVKLYRNEERLGLIMTRTLGAKYATGDAIVFLDAHCECNKNWLVPLLARIAYDRTIMAVPIVDGIDWDNFRYSPVYQGHEHFRGIFEWGFLYKESHVPKKELDKRTHNSEPYWSPTHAGGLFAMSREYFLELGAYDEGLQIWGGENFELSFKIWQCGGSIEWVPCSRVGHVYRNHMPYGFGKLNTKIPVIQLNYMRVVEVWLDPEYKEYFYTREPTVKGYPIGNITKQLEFKKSHQCKSFDWFMQNIAYEVFDKFPRPPPNQAWGEIKERNGGQCWDTYGQGPGGRGAIGTSSCHHQGGNQLFRLNTEGQLSVGERCIDRSSAGINVIFCPVVMSGPWSYDQETGLIRHTRDKKCVHHSETTLGLTTCDENAPTQQWDINALHLWS